MMLDASTVLSLFPAKISQNSLFVFHRMNGVFVHFFLCLTHADLCLQLPRDLAARLLQMIPDNEILLAKLCAFYPGSSAEINDLHEKVTASFTRPNVQH